MKKKAIIITCSALGAAAVAAVAIAVPLATCSGNSFSYDATDKSYSFVQREYETPAVDDGMVIDGIPDESVYTASGRKWYKGLKSEGNEQAKLSMTSYFTDKGLYFAFDVEEINNGVYYNPARGTDFNSGVEMYLAMEGATSLKSLDTFEIDMTCSGRLYIKQGFYDRWYNAHKPDGRMVLYAAQPKGGPVNSVNCYGYTGEMFIPYTYLQECGLLEEGETCSEVYVNPVLITTYSYDGTSIDFDRNWYNTAAVDTDGDGWSHPSSFLHFDKDGLVSYDINTEITGKGKIQTPKGYDFALKDNSVTLNVEAEEGYTLRSLKINEKEYKDELTYVDGVQQIKLYAVQDDIDIKAEFAEITTQKRAFSGIIKPMGVNAANGISDMVAKLYDGFKYIDLRTVNGCFVGNVNDGDYELVVLSKLTDEIVTQKNVSVSETSTNVVVEVDDTMYGANRIVYIGGAVSGGADETTYRSSTDALKMPANVTNQRFVWNVSIGMAQKPQTLPDRYILNYRLFTASGTNVCLQLVKWGNGLSFKIWIDGHSVQEFVLSAAVKQVFEATGKIDFAFVRNFNKLEIYARDNSNEFVTVTKNANHYKTFDSAIVSYSLSVEWDTGMPQPSIGFELGSAVVYQGTTDISVLKNND